MKIRYYLRGLGLGILFTSIFFLVSNGTSTQTMSDAEIKARAKELGMIESTVLAEISTKETVETLEEADTEAVSDKEIETVEELSAEEVETQSSEAESVEEESSVIVEETSEEPSTTGGEALEEETLTEAESGIDQPSENAATNTAPVSIVVNRGEGSDTVSRRLAEAGLVADAHEYDRYLMANGYDKRIGAGEHVIPAGATWKEIAEILCN